MTKKIRDQPSKSNDNIRIRVAAVLDVSQNAICKMLSFQQENIVSKIHKKHLNSPFKCKFFEKQNEKSEGIYYLQN